MILCTPQGMPMGTQPAMMRALVKVGLVTSSIQAAADEHPDHEIDVLRANGIRFPVWQVDQVLRDTTLNSNGKMQFKARLAAVGLLVENDAEVPRPRITCNRDAIEYLKSLPQ